MVTLGKCSLASAFLSVQVVPFLHLVSFWSSAHFCCVYSNIGFTLECLDNCEQITLLLSKALV